jgi:uncharacterized integral membrane protein
MTQPDDPTKYLPPKPDPVTGEPRPPHAPNFRGDEKYNRNSQDRRLSRKPSPPPGQSPVLAWRQASPLSVIRAGFWALLLVVVLFSLTTLSNRHGLFYWMRYWPVWLILVAGVVAAGLTIGSDRCSAGADWLKYRKSWVRTYELTVIMVSYEQGKPALRLTDRDKRVLSITAEMLWSNRLIWDLLCNGIRHSVAHGAAHNDAATGLFQLPDQ